MTETLRTTGVLAAYLLPVIATIGMVTGQWLPTAARPTAGDPNTQCPEGCGRPVHSGPCNGGGQR